MSYRKANKHKGYSQAFSHCNIHSRALVKNRSLLSSLCFTLFSTLLHTTTLRTSARKRGGSVDNLLDDLDGDGHASTDAKLTQEAKQKSVSSKNLSSGAVEEVKITTV